MIFFFITLIFSNILMANPSLRWMSAIEIVEKHEFYQDGQVITNPKETWQTLFGVLYGDGHGYIRKDCLYFRVPGATPGILKIITTSRQEACDKFLFEESSEKWEKIKALQFFITEEKISISMTFPAYKTEKWDIERLNRKTKLKPIHQMSSAEYRSGPIIYLSSFVPVNSKEQVTGAKAQEKNKLCHGISDDCLETSPSVCGDCVEGWYEVPNGCRQGPKYCGVQECGKKHQPACRRGMKWQRVKKNSDCRVDNSFAYCAKGLEVICEGSQARCL